MTETIERLTDEQIAEIGERAEARWKGPMHYAVSDRVALHRELLATRAELAELRERLPRTRDGVSLSPRMDAFPRSGTVADERVRIDAVYAAEVRAHWYDGEGELRWTHLRPEELYSTAAARDAAEGEQ